MSLNGVAQLERFVLRYCQHGGSSQYLRNLAHNQQFVAFAQTNPSVTIEFVRQNGKHPFVKAEYVCGKSHTVDLRNSPPNEIVHVLEKLKNRRPRKMSKLLFWQKPKTKLPSIQGTWTSSVKPVAIRRVF